MIDRLPDDKLDAVHHLMATLVEPLSESLANVPTGDHELSDETLASIKRGRRCFEREEFTLHDEMVQEFGVEMNYQLSAMSR